MFIDMQEDGQVILIVCPIKEGEGIAVGILFTLEALEILDPGFVGLTILAMQFVLWVKPAVEVLGDDLCIDRCAIVENSI